jgi:hypothetical protein
LVLKDAAAHHHRPLLHVDAAELTAVRTRLRATQEPALLGGGLFERSRRQPRGSSHGHVLHLAQIDIQSRPAVAESLPHDNFSPALGKLGDGLQILGSQLA